MKIRFGFVTNSSSSSFIIAKSCLTEKQIRAIRAHGALGEKLGLKYTDCPWKVSEDKDSVEGYTAMDNFDMARFLELIGVEDRHIEWDGFDPIQTDFDTPEEWEKLLDED